MTLQIINKNFDIMCGECLNKSAPRCYSFSVIIHDSFKIRVQFKTNYAHIFLWRISGSLIISFKNPNNTHKKKDVLHSIPHKTHPTITVDPKFFFFKSQKRIFRNAQMFFWLTYFTNFHAILIFFLKKILFTK